MPDGSYRKVREGEVSPISIDTAKILTGEKTYTPAEKANVTDTRTPKPEAGAKILRAEDEPSKTNDALQGAAQDKATAPVAPVAGSKTPRPVKDPSEVKSKNWTPEEKAHIDRMNAIAKEVVDNHKPLTADQMAAAIDPANKANKVPGAGARLAALKHVKDNAATRPSKKALSSEKRFHAPQG